MLKSLILVILFATPAFACPRIYGIKDTNCDGKLRLVFFGDSMTQGIGAGPGEDYPSQVGKVLPRAIIVNYGSSGESTFDGVIRAKALFASEKKKADYVFILEGLNDYPLGRPIPESMTNLFQMRNYAINAGAKPMLGSLVYLPYSGAVTDYVNTFNAWLSAFIQMDFSILTDAHLHIGQPFSGHPNAEGYKAMAAIAINAMLDS